MFRTIAVSIILVALAPAHRALAHQELYHNVDVDLVDAAEPGVVSIYFTIHAPELLVGFGEAGDAMFDQQWMSERTDEELERIVALSRVFLKERFEIRVEGSEAVDLERAVAFETFDRIRSAVARKELPPACLLGTVRLEMPHGAGAGGGALHFGHAADSEKRLLLVVIRPKAFPEVIDVGAGKAAVVELPAVAGVAEKKDSWIYGAMVAAMLVVTVFLQMRRGRRLVERKLVRRE